MGRGRPRTRPSRAWFEVVDVRVERRAGRLVRGQPGVGELGVEWVPWRLGGERAFWRCPVCGRRCEVLFRALVAPLYCRAPASYGTACGRCQRVAYETTALGRVDRLFAKRAAILARLGISGATPKLPAAYVLKPPRMHFRTFERELARARRLEAAALGAGLGALRGERLAIGSGTP